ncbi:DEP domain-containing protein 1B-like [Styela clava]
MFQYTEMWNEIQYNFTSKICVKTHYRFLKTYRNTFTGSSATTAMLGVLRDMPRFEKATTKQSKKVLNKLLQNHIIENVKPSDKDTGFSNSKTLYRFCSSSFSDQEEFREILKQIAQNVGMMIIFT